MTTLPLFAQEVIALVEKHAETTGSFDALRSDIELLTVTKIDDDDCVIVKVDDEQRMVWGWANVTTKGGELLVDRQGDMLETEDLRKAVYAYMDDRTLGRMHKKRTYTDENVIAVGKVRDSIILDAAVQKALGINLGQEGWFVGVHVEDEGAWQAVKNGDLRAFSLGGKGQREPVNA